MVIPNNYQNNYLSPWRPHSKIYRRVQTVTPKTQQTWLLIIHKTNSYLKSICSKANDRWQILLFILTFSTFKSS